MNNKVMRYMAGKHINLIMKSIKGSQQLPDGSIVRGNVVVEGYLLDEDDKFFYLGTVPEEVNDCVAKSDTMRITLSDGTLDEQVMEFEDDEDTGRH